MNGSCVLNENILKERVDIKLSIARVGVADSLTNPIGLD